MSVTQQYWLTWGPILAFVGVMFSPSFMVALFVPSYLAYYAHSKEWTLWQFAYRATLIACVLLFVAMSKP